MVNQSGYPGSVVGSTLTFATTNGGSKNRRPYVYYGQQIGGQYVNWESKAFFFSQRKILLAFDWTVSFEVSLAGFSNVNWVDMDEVLLACQVGLSDKNNSLDGPFAVLRVDGHHSSSGLTPGDSEQYMLASRMENGFSNGNIVPRISLGYTAADPIVIQCTYAYDYKTDTLVLDAGGKKATIGSASSYLEDESAYLCVGGRARWTNYEEDQQAVDLHPRNFRGTLDFDSIELPNFDPDIVEFKIYNLDTNVEIAPSDCVQPNTKVRVVCQVKNTNAAAADLNYPETFNVHFKWDAAATTNFAVDTSSPVKVNGTPVSESLSSGVPLKLSGTDTVTVEYVGKIGSAIQSATTLGVSLTDDIFGVAVKDSITLVEASNLVEGSGLGDPSLTPGTDYHYTRLPAANDNGWNNTPVTVSFYAGEYDSFTITPLASAPVVLAGGGSKTWTEEVDSMPVTYQGTSGDGVSSVAVSDTVRIDTTPPRLSYDKVTGSVTVDDTPAARSGGVTSGAWHLYATDASGAPTSTVQTFTLTGGKGPASQTVSGVAGGYYVAEDAAGNRSEVLEVREVVPPQADRPEGSGLPDPPAPTVSTDFDGTKHAVYEETIT
ncbi:hypothetical protein VJ918_09630, partial [Adlercreutzia sp. R21]|uniref:hypothetical protein n=1 Tax=Adlercreutzia wanghongyangiae TaxID=3111451 RepID=UPI002DB5D097